MIGEEILPVCCMACFCLCEERIDQSLTLDLFRSYEGEGWRRMAKEGEGGRRQDCHFVNDSSIPGKAPLICVPRTRNLEVVL
jgi:hypothetical protein